MFRDSWCPRLRALITPRAVLGVGLLAGTLLVGVVPVLASDGGGMPWDGPLDAISANLSGPTARRLMIIAIVVVGLGMMFSEGGSVFRKLLYVAAGGILVSAAASWGLPFIGFAEAAAGPRRPVPGMDAWIWCWTLGVLLTLGTWLGLHMEAQERQRFLEGAECRVPERGNLGQ
jgi:type IV secretory pathway VirB2 component (pilin)